MWRAANSRPYNNTPTNNNLPGSCVKAITELQKEAHPSGFLRQDVLLAFGKQRLLEALLNSNSHGDGHADHGVVACAQEASEARFRGGI